MHKAAALIAVILFSGLGPSLSAAVPLEPEDAAGIRKACEAYVSSWLANDKVAVLATIADDAVLMPAHGRPAIVGKRAIETFWWPTGPPTTVTAFTSTVDEVGGMSRFGWARGSFHLTFTYQNKSTSQNGTYLMLLRREPNGAWLITHRMWDDVLKR